MLLKKVSQDGVCLADASITMAFELGVDGFRQGGDRLADGKEEGKIEETPEKRVAGKV